MIRISKVLCVAAIAFYCLLVVFGNITDYYVNFSAVENTLAMKEIYANSSIGYRALTNHFVHHVFFLIIIICEALVAILCTIGAWRLFTVRGASAQIFNQTKNWAIAGLTCGFLTWQVLFMSIGGEWFGVWMSSSLHGAITQSFQIFMTILAVLIYLIIKDE